MQEVTSSFEVLPTGKQHISFSEVKLWKECSYRHNLVHIKKLSLFKPSPALDFGTAVHASCEHYLLTREMKPEIAFDSMEKAWATNSTPENPDFTQASLAKSKLDNESSLLERQKKLWASEIGTKNDLDTRELAYKNASNLYNASNLKLNDLKKQIALQSKQSKNSAAISSNLLNDFKVISEIDGRVYGISKLAGEMATPQLPIAIIGNANEFYVEMQVDEYDISKMSAGQKVYITMDSYKDKVFEAVVTKIYPLMNLKLKSFKVDATFTNKPDNLFPNISAQANIVIQVKEKAMIIPRSYLIDNEYVYLKNKEKRKVKVGLMDYEKVEILSGISVNDELVKSIQ